MKTRSSLSGLTARRKLIVMSCASALAAFALLAGPVQAEEVATSDQVNTATIAAVTETSTSTASSSDTAATDQAQAEAESIATETAPADATNTAATEDASATTDSAENPTAESAEDSSAIASASSETEATASTEAVSESSESASPGYYSDDQGNWYYRDTQGNNLTGAQTIDGQQVYFRDNGQQVKGPLANANNFLERYYDVDSGQLLTERFVEYNGNWYYLGADGRPVKGEQTIDDQEYYFDNNGQQLKGDFTGASYTYPQNSAYYDPNSGAKVTQAGFVQNRQGQTFYLDNQGIRVTGVHAIDGDLYYFNIVQNADPKDIGVLQKGVTISLEGDSNSPRQSYGFGVPTNITRRYYFDESTGKAVKNRFIGNNNVWTYYGADGNSIRPQAGEVTVNGQTIYLYKDGRQAKGELVLDNGTLRYYDADSGERVTNTTLTINGMTYTFDGEGKGSDAPNPNGYYSDAEGNWYYKNRDGVNLTGNHIIGGQEVSFDSNGKQIKSGFYDVNSGQRLKNRYVEVDGNWYYVDEDGDPLKGAYTIDGQEVLFDATTGRQIKGQRVREGVYLPYYSYDKDSGAKIKNAFVTEKTYYGSSYVLYLDENGREITGFREIDGYLYYFQPAIATSRYAITGQMYRSSTRTIDGVIYTFDDQGHATKVS